MLKKCVHPLSKGLNRVHILKSELYLSGVVYRHHPSQFIQPDASLCSLSQCQVRNVLHRVIRSSACARSETDLCTDGSQTWFSF